MILHRFLFASLIVVYLINFTFSATLPKDEVEALRIMAKKLGNKSWNFSGDPCNLSYGSMNPNSRLENTITCDCSFVDQTVCHVTKISLGEQNLQGVLPAELARIPFLQEIDLRRNYINGSIPPEWGSLPLISIYLQGNRLTGPVPKELGNISTLVTLNLDYNQLSGELPAELGDLQLLKKLRLSSNNFSGEIPRTLSKLTRMEEFRISDNQFTGKVPDFIGNWTNLDNLVIQASGLVGPIPDSFFALDKLTDLRLSDLDGPESPFPPLSNMTKIEILILRNCNLTGQLPDYLGQKTSLKTLDLSFNKLNGGIPNTYRGLMDVNFMYLTGNLLSGIVPQWMIDKGKRIDLSYNNFAEQSVCQQRGVNLFASSSNTNNSGTISCLRNYVCPKRFYGLHINCGGDEVTINGKRFGADRTGSGPANFYDSKNGWVMSNTGNFLHDDRRPKGLFTWTNSSKLAMNDSRLYMQARLSPISLTYHAFCLGDGNYTANLHFAEIVYADDNTYSSSGRRLFDIYVQGKLVQKDFNIRNEAGGAGKAIVRKFPVTVMNNTVDIRLYWAGKGTIAIPTRGVYGPLISAISIDPDFVPPKDVQDRNKISVGKVIGLAIAATAFSVFLTGGILWWKGCLRSKTQMLRDFKNMEFHVNSFSLRQIKAATNNFDAANKIGEGGFGPVYMGELPDGTTIAVKQLSSRSRQGNREFLNEIGMISALQHPNLVNLYGCCVEGDQLLLIYEYLENNCLARALFGREESQLRLDWPTRKKVCIGIARGLAYLHEESRLKIVHRDIKATNVLLDKELNPKISDFGLAKLSEEDNTHISTRIAGTLGYMAPEYAMRGRLTEKADVYSFGIVALEIVSGTPNNQYRSEDDSFYLLDWVRVLKEKGKLMELVDPRLGNDYDEEEATAMTEVSLLCTSASASDRPSMSSVVSMLEGRTVIDIGPDSRLSNNEAVKAAKKHYELALEELAQTDHGVCKASQILAASSSASDLYPVNLDSAYWDNRV